MAKQTGLGDYLAVDDSGGTARDISDNVVSYDANLVQNLIEATSLSKSTVERIPGINDGTFPISGVADFASNKSHDVFKTRTGVRTFDLRIGGNTSSNPRLQVECRVASYNLSRGADGALNWTAELMVSDGAAIAYDTVP